MPRTRPWKWTAPAPRPVLSSPPPQARSSWQTPPLGGGWGVGRHGGGDQLGRSGVGAAGRAHAGDCDGAGAIFLPGKVGQGGPQLPICGPCPAQADYPHRCSPYRWRLCTLHYVMYSLSGDNSLDYCFTLHNVMYSTSDNDSLGFTCSKCFTLHHVMYSNRGDVFLD